MIRLSALLRTETRLLARDWTVLAFAFVFPPFVMLILAGVFGTQPTVGFGWRQPDHYYVAASVGVPVIALAVVGLPVTLGSYREHDVFRRLEAFGVAPAQLIAVQAIVTSAMALLGTGVVLAVALPVYGIPPVVHPGLALLGLAAGTVTLVLLGIAVGLASGTARAAQAIGLMVFFALYLLGGGGPPRGAMTGAMHTIASALPSPIPAVVDPWLGLPGRALQLGVCAAWAAIAVAVIARLARRERS